MPTATHHFSARGFIRRIAVGVCACCLTFALNVACGPPTGSGNKPHSDQGDQDTSGTVSNDGSNDGGNGPVVATNNNAASGNNSAVGENSGSAVGENSGSNHATDPAANNPGNADNTPPGQPAIPRPTIRIQLPDECEPFAIVEAVITITNVADVPMMLFDIDVRPRDGQPALIRSWFQQRPAVPLPNGGLGIRAAWLVEDPGPAARGPQPPAWHWEGQPGDLIGTCLVLGPGEKIEQTARFRATYDLGDRLGCRITAAPLTGDTSWLMLAGKPRVTHERKPFAAAAIPGAGPRWFEEMQLAIDFTPITEPLQGGYGLLDIDPGEQLVPGNPAIGGALQIYRIGSSAQEFASRQPSNVMAAAPLRIGRCSPDIDEAREMVGIAEGDFERAIALQMWAILDKDANDGSSLTWLVNGESKVSIDGNVLPLIQGLNLQGTQTLQIFRGSPEPDPPGAAGGQLEYFQAAGMQIRRSRADDGTWTGIVIVEPDQLLQLGDCLRDLGLRIDGSSAVPFR